MESIPDTLKWPQYILNQGGLTRESAIHAYKGNGTEEDPFCVEFVENDSLDPMQWSKGYKWAVTMMTAMSTLTVTLASTTFTGGIFEIMGDYETSLVQATLGVALFVLGFAVGPLLFAPLSEEIGRRHVQTISSVGLTLFSVGVAVSQSDTQINVLRFFAGAIGSAPIVNSGAIIADLFSAEERGLAMGVFSICPFASPALGGIIGNFVGMNTSWRWVCGLICIFAGVICILQFLFVPETFAVRLLKRRADRLTKLTGKVYKSRIEIEFPPKNKVKYWKNALLRPFVLLFQEPIVIILSIYQAVIYGILYMLFGAFPIVYSQLRGWNQGVASLPFIGVLVGMLLALIYQFYDQLHRYVPLSRKLGGKAPPESRLPTSFPGAVFIPLGLFLFAWTSYINIHWFPSVLGASLFGAGMVLIFLSLINYLVDSYTIFAASVLAASSVLRSLIGFMFPLVTPKMFGKLGIQWGASLPAFISLAAAPFPFIFYKYGAYIRSKCKYTKRAMDLLDALHNVDKGEKPTEDPSNTDFEHEVVEEYLERHISRIPSRKTTDE